VTSYGVAAEVLDDLGVDPDRQWRRDIGVGREQDRRYRPQLQNERIAALAPGSALGQDLGVDRRDRVTFHDLVWGRETEYARFVDGVSGRRMQACRHHLLQSWRIAGEAINVASSSPPSAASRTAIRWSIVPIDARGADGLLYWLGMASDDFLVDQFHPADLADPFGHL
jgi:hypothetical protein